MIITATIPIAITATSMFALIGFVLYKLMKRRKQYPMEEPLLIKVALIASGITLLIFLISIAVWGNNIVVDYSTTCVQVPEVGEETPEAPIRNPIEVSAISMLESGGYLIGLSIQEGIQFDPAHLRCRGADGGEVRADTGGLEPFYSSGRMIEARCDSPLLVRPVTLVYRPTNFQVQLGE